MRKVILYMGNKHDQRRWTLASGVGGYGYVAGGPTLGSERVEVVPASALEGAVDRAEKAEAKVSSLEAIIWKHRHAIGAADVPSYMDGMTAT